MIERIDHIVLTCRDLETTIAWYERVLGFQREEFGPQRRTALKFGRQKFNVRPVGSAGWRTARQDAPGSLDLCFITEARLDDVIDRLRRCAVEFTGPSAQIGALGAMTSVYCSDPDGNLIEIASYEQPI